MKSALANACPPERQAQIVERYRKRTRLSAAAHAKARQVLPGGINRNIVYHRPHPLFFACAKGAWLTDLDGNEYLDCNGNYTSMILGNCVPEVMDAVTRQVALGTAWAGASAAEAELARLLVRRLPTAEQVRFTASGSEAAMMALRLARATTGRPLIAKMEGGYHGLSDYAMISVAPPPDAGRAQEPQAVSAPGVTPGVAAGVLVLPFNDAAATADLIQRHATRLAAIIVEPVLGVGGIIAPQPGYLELLRDLASRHGILLIFDEVISFRLSSGGAQQRFGVAPDLTVLGKIIGGGYPIGAVAGSEVLMRRFDPAELDSVSLSGTFHANPVALAAGIATLELVTPKRLDRLNRAAEALALRVAALLRRAALPLSINAVGSLLALHTCAEPVTSYRAAAAAPRDGLAWLYLALLNEGVLLSPRGMGCLSLAMSTTDHERFLTAMEAALVATGLLQQGKVGARA